MADVTARPRLLFLCQTLPYPPDGGVWMRTYHILKLLASAFDITALCFERAGTRDRATARDLAASRAGLGRLAHTEVFDLPQKHSRPRFAWDHLRSAMLGRVYTTYLYDSPPLRRRLAELVESGRFDLVHFDSLDLAQYLPGCGGLPVVCVHHDVESALLGRRASAERGWHRRAYLAYQARLMRRVERTWCGRVALNVVVSEQDRGVLEGLAPSARVVVVPNGVDVDEFQPDSAEGTGVAFVGGTSPFPNKDALDFFCERVLPHLRAASVDVPVKWIGRASGDEQRRYRERFDVELTGYVEDARPFMRGAACHIVPLRAGGGTRLKILHAWALGKAVVSTSIGAEGLAAANGENILIRDDPKSFAHAVATVLDDAALRRRLGAHGRRTAERTYSWTAIGRGMIDTYLRLSVPPIRGGTSERCGSSRAASLEGTDAGIERFRCHA